MSADQITPERIAAWMKSLEFWNDSQEMAIPVPTWRDILDALTAYRAEVQRLTERSVSMEAEIRILREEISRRSDAGRVEVPELDGGANPYQRNIENPGSFGWLLNKAFREGYDCARKLSRLSPSPQPATGAVVIPEWDDAWELCYEGRPASPKEQAAFRNCWQFAVHKFREANPSPQPSADVVVVPRSAAEYAIRAFDWIECPDPEHYEALRAFYGTLHSSTKHDSKET